MNDFRTPKWLGQFQDEFTKVIRKPLSTKTGMLHSLHSDVGEKAYNRQYWFRLFTVMQNELPLTARLLGFWDFNLMAKEFLFEYPPSHVELVHVTDGFLSFLDNHLKNDLLWLSQRKTNLPRSALIQAATLDLKWQSVFLAPSVSPWIPSPEDAATLAEKKLIQSPVMEIYTENWPWMETRNRVTEQEGLDAITLPEKLKEENTWLIFQNAAGFGQWLLEPEQAMLYQEATRSSLAQALQKIEQRFAIETNHNLPQKVSFWLQKGMENGFWIGAESC